MDARLLQRKYDQVLHEAQSLRISCRDLKQELNVCRPELYRADQKIDRLEQSNAKYKAQSLALRRKLADLTFIDGNPLQNIKDLRRVRRVIKDGNVYDVSSLVAGR